MEVILDASAIMAIILNESYRYNVIKLTENAMLLSPEVVSFEIGNALINLFKRGRISKEELLEAYKNYSLIPLRLVNVDVQKALKIACEHNILACDAYYLEAAFRLKLPLITFDQSMKRVGTKLRINILDKYAKRENEDEGL